jgi:hypothetical protein
VASGGDVCAAWPSSLAFGSPVFSGDLSTPQSEIYCSAPPVNEEDNIVVVGLVGD